MRSFLVITLSAVVSLMGCKYEPAVKSMRSPAKPLAIAEGVGNGLSVSGQGFVWQKSELPVCYSARAGLTFFVWKEQSRFACVKGKKGWQIVTKKNG